MNKARELQEDVQRLLDSRKVEIEVFKLERDELMRNVENMKEALKETMDKVYYLS